MMINSIQTYYQNLKSMPVQPDIKPGFLKEFIPDTAPEHGRDFKETLRDIEKNILPNLTHWQHPNFFAYFPTAASHIAAATEMYTHCFNTPNFSWHVSPATHEIEWIISDWVVKLFGMPEKFLMKNSGGGKFMNSTTETVVLSLNCARKRKIEELNLAVDDVRRLKFSAYYAESNKTWAGKALHINEINFKRSIPLLYSEEIENYVVDYEFLENKINEDIQAGYIPIWYGAQIGSTDCCVKDDLIKLGEICEKYKIFLSVDCAYSGSFFICEEYRPPLNSFDKVDAVTLNFCKNLLMGVIGAFYLSADKAEFIKSTGMIKGKIFEDDEHNPIPIDYKDWNIGLSRKFTSLKFYNLLNTYGAEGIRKYIRECVRRGEFFTSLFRTRVNF